MAGKTTPDRPRLMDSLKRSINKESIFAFIAAVITMIGLMIGVVPVLRRGLDGQNIFKLTMIKEQQWEDLRAQVRNQSEVLLDLQNKMQSLPTPGNDSQIAIQISQINGAISKLQASTSGIEKVILDDPAKALAVPLLRRDLDNLKAGQQSDLISLQKEIDRVYDLNKWLVGLMFTMALGVLSLAISNFWRAKEKEKKTEA